MEVFRGDREERLQIASYLDGLRTYYPGEEFSPRTTNTRFSRWLEQSQTAELFNIELFNRITTDIEAHIRRFDSQYNNLSYERYVIGMVPNTNIDTGGFNSRYSRGFKYLSNWGYAALLNRRYTTNPDIAAIEMARSYLHDSMHAASFRTIRWHKKGTQSTFPVYREQYGFNFRKANGSSYSVNPSPDDSPNSINLNLLMDGIVVITTGKELEPYLKRYKSSELNDFEKTIISDIKYDVINLPETYRGRKFHEQVTLPSEKFIEHWGGEELYEILVRGMLTGKFRDLVLYFNSNLQTNNAWQKLFKAQTFK